MVCKYLALKELYIDAKDINIENKLNNIPKDTEEVSKQWWQDINAIPYDKWIIIDHKKIVAKGIEEINNFNKLDNKEKEEKKFTNLKF